MVLYIVGLGLGDEKDITVKGLECVKSCTRLYLEFYTSVLGIEKEKLQDFYGVPVVYADRDMVETQAEEIYAAASTENIGFLVVGDPLCATTHTDLILRARALNIQVDVIHNASCMAAVASCGLQLYKFGYTVSICLFEGEWRPASFYDRVKYNKNGGMHTLCLLDIKVKEPDYEQMCSGKMRYLPPRFMSINTAIAQMLEVEEDRKEGIITKDSMAVGMARLGQHDQTIVYGSLAELLDVDFGPPLHCLALCGTDVHPLEEDILKYFLHTPEMHTFVPLEDREEEDVNGLV